MIHLPHFNNPTMNILTSFQAGQLTMKKTSLILCILGAVLLPVLILLFEHQSPEGMSALRNDPWMLYLEEGFCRCILF